MVLNKTDRLSTEEVGNLETLYDGIGVSALAPSTLEPLLSKIEQVFWQSGRPLDILGGEYSNTPTAETPNDENASDVSSWNPLDY